MEDSYRHKGLRKKLIDILKEKGISNSAILEVMLKIPRHFFLDKAFEEWAYQDVAFPIDSDQTISQPYTVAFQTSLLEVENTHQVLEIGTGSGYQACVLYELANKVYSIERHEQLFHKTSKLLKQIGYGNIRTVLGDGYKGMPQRAPFDRILVTCGAPDIPDALKEQLKIGGKMVIPVGQKNQKMIRLTRQSEKRFIQESFGDFKFVPFLKGIHPK